MRIGLVSPYAWTVPGGVNNHVMSLVRYLERAGNDVYVIAPAGDLKHSQTTIPTNFISAGHAFPVPSNGSVAYVNGSFFMLGKMSRILDPLKLDIVHVHEPTIPAVGASATMMAKAPVVGTFHAAGAASAFYERWRPLAERILASITLNIVVSETARQTIIPHFPGEYRVIPNGIDIGRYAAARDGEKVPGRILFIGRPEPRKGLPALLEAFQGLRKRVPEASLVCAGPTPEEVQALASRGRGMPERSLEGVTALGRVPHDVKIREISAAQALCAPSNGGESFGIILVEAMASGLPVVASDIPGYRAVLAEGTAGVLVPPDDPSALENALFGLLRNPELQQELIASGLARAERYSWDRLIGQVTEAYQDAIALGPRVVAESPVPGFAQAVHFARTWSRAITRPREREAQEARGPAQP
jgi:phosphatidyl-myo-inositol alpha-mannosyltransferase